MSTKRKKIKKNKTRKNHKPYINSNFDSGSINILSTNIGEKNCHFKLSLQKEIINEGNKSQYWFYFKVGNIKNKTCFFSLHTHVDCNNGFKQFGVSMSYDNKKWIRYKTNQTNKKTKCKINNRSLSVRSTKMVTWKIKPKHNTIWFAYYVPYPFEKSTKLIHSLSKKSFITKNVIGKSHDNRTIHMLTIGNGDKNVWIIGRQHPGESIASYIIEGFLRSVVSPLSNVKLRIIPTLNPDGIFKGYWYTNKNGVNQNLDWKNPKSREVKLLSKLLKKQNNDLILDIHGDEECRKHFLSHCPTKNIKLYKKVNALFCKFNSNFQREDYYKKLNFPCDGKTLDSYDNALTLEGALKHRKGNINTEGFKIGYTIYKVLNVLFN